MDSFWVGINGYGGKRKPLGDLNTSRDQVSKKPNLEEVFPEDLEERDGYFNQYYVAEYGYTFVDCVRQAYYDNYTKMREKRRTIRPLELLEAATDDAVTKCGGNRDDIYAYLLYLNPSQNMHMNNEVWARQNAEEELEKERKKLFYDTERELEPEEYYYYPPFYFKDLPSTNKRYLEKLYEATNVEEELNTTNPKEDSSDSDNEATNVKEDLDTTNPDTAEPPDDLDKSSSRNSENSSDSDDEVTNFQDDLFFSQDDDSSEEVEFNKNDFLDK